MSDDETPSGDQPAAADGEPTDRGPLRRSRRHRMLAGVCGGLGEHFGLDPVIFRIGFAALVVLGGSGILLYILAWLLIPEAGHDGSLAEHVVRRGSSGAGRRALRAVHPGSPGPPARPHAPLGAA